MVSAGRHHVRELEPSQDAPGAPAGRTGEPGRKPALGSGAVAGPLFDETTFPLFLCDLGDKTYFDPQVPVPGQLLEMAVEESSRNVPVALKSANLLGALSVAGDRGHVCVQPRVRLTLLGCGVCAFGKDTKNRVLFSWMLLQTRCTFCSVMEMANVLMCEGRGSARLGWLRGWASTQE